LNARHIPSEEAAGASTPARGAQSEWATSQRLYSNRERQSALPRSNRLPITPVMEVYEKLFFL
jgi:hypothetical protein